MTKLRKILDIIDITKRKRLEKQLQKCLKERKVILKEIHHRVKNNLMIISSLLNLQSNQITNKEQAICAFEKSKDRINSMALVHEYLYRSKDFSRINMKYYIEKMSRLLIWIYAVKTKVNLVLNIKDVFLDIDYAVPCGLIINELVTNSLKHAFPNVSIGTIIISFHLLKDKTYKLVVQDDGVGLPEGFNLSKTKSLGLQIVKILSEQISGVLKVTSKEGGKFQIKIPVKKKLDSSKSFLFIS